MVVIADTDLLSGITLLLARMVMLVVRDPLLSGIIVMIGPKCSLFDRKSCFFLMTVQPLKAKVLYKRNQDW